MPDRRAQKSSRTRPSTAKNIVGPNGDPEAEERHRERYYHLKSLATHAVPESIDGFRHLLIAADADVDELLSMAADGIEAAGITYVADRVRRMLRNAITYADARVEEAKRNPA